MEKTEEYLKYRGEPVLRHGDLIVRRWKGPIPAGAKPLNNNGILAYGESTGHKHQLCSRQGVVSTYESGTAMGQVEFFETGFAQHLSHEEHPTLEVPKGIFVIEHEAEYDPLKAQIARTSD